MSHTLVRHIDRKLEPWWARLAAYMIYGVVLLSVGFGMTCLMIIFIAVTFPYWLWRGLRKILWP